MVDRVLTRKDEKARAMIGLALEDGQLAHIMDAATSNEMWEMLKGYHERGSLSNKIHVLRRLCSMRLNEAGNMADHLVEASKLVHRLARMGESLKEHLVVAILLSSLPESYNPLVTALEGRPEEDLKLEYVKGKLMDEWRRRCDTRPQEEIQEQAMKCTVLQEDRRNIRICYHCRQTGHIQWCCPALQKERGSQAERKTFQQKSMAVHHLEPGREVCFTATASGSVSDKRKWIIDTGCSKHMTNSIANFGQWSSCAAKISLADGRTVMARGSGTGKITGRGGEGGSVEIKVKELLFVPELTVNVLSVSRMTDEGYFVQFGPKECRIMDGSVVVAVGEKISGLYYLKQ